MFASVAFTILLGLMAAGSGVAQQRPEGPPADTHQRQAFLLDVMSSQLNLSKEQRGQLQGILEKARESAAPVHEQILKTRELVRNSIREGKPATTLDPLHRQLGHMFAQLVAMESKAFGEISAILTPEQKANSDVAYNMLGMLMAPPRPGGRGFRPPAQK